MTPQWPRCNGMVKQLVKTLKHGLIMFFATIEHVQNWDEHFPWILFGYKFGVQASTCLSLHIILISHTPILQANIFLSSLVNVYDEDDPRVLIE